MSIIEHQGNLLEGVTCGIIVHGCNSLGVMGAGFAEALKNKYPAVFRRYHAEYKNSGLRLGQVVWARAVEDANGRPVLVVANAITQNRLAKRRGEVVVSYEAIEEAFQTIRKAAEKSRFPVHFPLIGCGLAGGKWERVAPLIETALGPQVEKHLWTL